MLETVAWLAAAYAVVSLVMALVLLSTGGRGFVRLALLWPYFLWRSSQ
jgi:hypothetical protein